MTGCRGNQIVVNRFCLFVTYNPMVRPWLRNNDRCAQMPPKARRTSATCEVADGQKTETTAGLRDRENEFQGANALALAEVL